MKKRILQVSLAIALMLEAIFFADFASAAWKWPSNLTIMTLGVGGAGHFATAAWTPVMEQMTGMKVRILPEHNEVLRNKWLRERKVEISSDLIFSCAWYMQGERQYATRDGGAFQARVVWPNVITTFGHMVRGDSKIKSIYDLKPGLRAAMFSVSQGQQANLLSAFVWVGIDKKDVIPVHFGSVPGFVRAIAEGKADITVCGPTQPAVFEAAGNPYGVRWLEFPVKEDPKGMKRALDFSPTMMFKRCTEGVESAKGVMMMAAPYLHFAHADTDSEMIYQIAKWMGENFDAYKDKHAMCKSLSIADFRDILDFIYLPVHEGTIRYLKEKRMWTAQDDSRQKYNVELLTRWEIAYKDATAEADKKEIKIDPKNKEWLDLWYSYKKDLPIFKTR